MTGSPDRGPVTELPGLALGCAPLGNLGQTYSDQEAWAVLEAAWDAGIRHYDTAPHYGLGLSERRVGEFLQTKPREDFVLSTKVGRLLRPNPHWDGQSQDGEGFAVPGRLVRHYDASFGGVRASLAESLERLGLDRIDIAYLHDPDRSRMPDATTVGMASLARARDDGLVRWIGVGSMDAPTVAAAVRTDLADLVMVAGRYTLLDQSVIPDVLDACSDHGTSIVAAAVFNSGLLADRPSSTATYDYGAVPADILDRARRIDEVCARHGVELPLAAIHFPRQDPRVVAVALGGATADQVRQNADRFAAGSQIAWAPLWRELEDEGLVRPPAF